MVMYAYGKRPSHHFVGCKVTMVIIASLCLCVCVGVGVFFFLQIIFLKALCHDIRLN